MASFSKNVNIKKVHKSKEAVSVFKKEQYRVNNYDCLHEVHTYNTLEGIENQAHCSSLSIMQQKKGIRKIQRIRTFYKLKMKKSLESIQESIPSKYTTIDHKMESIEIEEKLAHTIEKSDNSQDRQKFAILPQVMDLKDEPRMKEEKIPILKKPTSEIEGL